MKHDLEVARRLGSASDSRRRNVERTLHDGVQQRLALVALRLSVLQRLIETAPAEATLVCDEVRGELAEALVDLRTVAQLIYPAILEHEGLGAALENAAARIHVQTVVDIDEDRLPVDLRQAFYFCCLGAIEHADQIGGPSATVRVRVRVEEGSATFEIIEEGEDLTVETASASPTLQHVRDRTEALGGAFELDATRDGTRIVGTVPLSA